MVPEEYVIGFGSRYRSGPVTRLIEGRLPGELERVIPGAGNRHPMLGRSGNGDSLPHRLAPGDLDKSRIVALSLGPRVGRPILGPFPLAVSSHFAPATFANPSQGRRA